MFLCPPAFVYMIFSLIQVFVDSFNGQPQMAVMKLCIMVVVTFLLNMLCGSGLSFVSWIIVLMPFIFMAVSVGILLFVFGAKVIHGEPIAHDSQYASTSQAYPNGDSTPPSPTPPPTCKQVKKQNWEVINGNVVFLPTYTYENVCK
jgi:hypothetical protein